MMASHERSIDYLVHQRGLLKDDIKFSHHLRAMFAVVSFNLDDVDLRRKLFKRIFNNLLNGDPIWVHTRRNVVIHWIAL